MPNQPRPSNGNRTLRFEDDLWADWEKACAELFGTNRNQRAVQRAQEDVDQWRSLMEAVREGEVYPTVDGIRGHKVMTPGEAKLARRVAKDAPPITRQQLIDEGLIP